MKKPTISFPLTVASKAFSTGDHIGLVKDCSGPPIFFEGGTGPPLSPDIFLRFFQGSVVEILNSSHFRHN